MKKLTGLVVLLAAACSAQPSGDSAWTELEPMTLARSEHPAVVVAGEVIILGGLVEAAPGQNAVTTTVEAYDPASDTWRALPDLPQPRHHLMAAVVDERVFAIGGFSGSGFDAVSTVWELVGETWEERAPLPEPIGAGAAAVLDDLVYVVGGAPSGGLYAYNPAADTWGELPTPGTEREHVAAVARDGEIWALGGRWHAAMHATTEIYDPATNTWDQGPTMNEARSGFGATVTDGEIVVAGGEVFNPDQALTSVELLTGGDWALHAELPVGLHGNPLVFLDEALYLPGGSTLAAGVDNPGTMYALPG